MSKDQNYESVIGLEIHLQLKTESKMFSPAPNLIWQAEPNSLVNPVELGLPGALPVPNATAIEWTQRFGLCLHCELSPESKFDRKNYFYPDLPKGYQISQYDLPFCINGYLDIPFSVNNSSAQKRIRIRRIHLEEDTGKSMHKDGNTYLDYNKAGTPLVELVTEPDFCDAEECSTFAKMVQSAARILGISDADMEKGHLRLEANVSVRKKGDPQLPNYRVELKNINSFKFMRDAVNYEIARQIEALEKGATLSQETRGWNENKGISVLQRKKEDAHDYRYFPEPDIPPLKFTTHDFEQISKDLPAMPWDIEAELVGLGVRADYANLIAYDHEKHTNFVNLNQKKITEPAELAKFIAHASNQGEVENKINEAKSKKEAAAIDPHELELVVRSVISSNPQAVEDYRKGKENAVKFLLGQIMKATQGQARPFETEPVIKKILDANN